MPLEELTSERQDILVKLSELSSDDLKAIEKLVERHQDILDMLKKDEAWSIVLSTIRTSALWITVVIGAIYMGIDKLAVFMRSLI